MIHCVSEKLAEGIQLLDKDLLPPAPAPTPAPRTMPGWMADLGDVDRTELTAMVTQAFSNYGGPTSAAKSDIAAKFQLETAQVHEAITYLYQGSVGSPEAPAPAPVPSPKEVEEDGGGGKGGKETQLEEKSGMSGMIIGLVVVLVAMLAFHFSNSGSSTAVSN